MGKLSYCACRRFMSKDFVQNQSFPVTLTQGGSWALLRKSAVELTTLAQPFCINHAVGDLARHFHFMGEYSTLDRVKMMGTHGKINAIWWNIKLRQISKNWWTYVDMNCQQICENSPKKTSEVKIFQKVLGGYIFLKHPVHSVHKKNLILFSC